MYKVILRSFLILMLTTGAVNAATFGAGDRFSSSYLITPPLTFGTSSANWIMEFGPDGVDTLGVEDIRLELFDSSQNLLGSLDFGSTNAAKSANIRGFNATISFSNTFDSVGSAVLTALGTSTFEVTKFDLRFLGNSGSGVRTVSLLESLTPVSPVPGPAAGLLLITALGGLGLLQRYKKNKPSSV